MIKKLIIAGLLMGFFAGGALAAWGVWKVLDGPRMRTQPSIRSFEAEMPKIPENAVPAAAEAKLPGELRARFMENPVRPTPETLKAGRIFYGYYCAFCHGKTGQGDGPVGQSYAPGVPEFNPEKIAKMSDGELYLAMLTGPGHRPVLPRIVKTNRRWPLVLYLRRLAAKMETRTEKDTAPEADKSQALQLETSQKQLFANVKE